MPKMMANMDPEQLEEMKNVTKGMQGGSLMDMLDPEKMKEKAKQEALEHKREEKGSGGGKGSSKKK